MTTPKPLQALQRRGESKRHKLMNARDFASEIVIPTVKEALEDRTNQRRVYVPSIVTCLAEYIAKETNSHKTAVYNNLRKVCEPAFEIVQGVCNGTKHAGNKSGFGVFEIRRGNGARNAE